MDDELTRKVAITAKGQQIPIESGSGVTVTIALADDDVKREVLVDVSTEQFDEMRKQALTNDIPAAILKTRKSD